MRFNRKNVETVQDVEYCRCPHANTLHGLKGCTGEVIRFRCEVVGFRRAARFGHQQNGHVEDCLIRLPCLCKFKGSRYEKPTVDTVEAKEE